MEVVTIIVRAWFKNSDKALTSSTILPMRQQGRIVLITLLKTKSFWVGLGLICTAIGLAIGGVITWPEAIEKILLGVGFITGRHAIAKLERKVP